MIGIYFTVDISGADPDFVEAYTEPKDPEQLQEFLREPVEEALGMPNAAPVSFTVPHRASRDLAPPFLYEEDDLQLDTKRLKETRTLVVPLQIDESKGPVKVTEKSLKRLAKLIDGARDAGADLAFETAYVPAPKWCRGEGLGRGFGTRAAALRAIGGDFLKRKELNGDKVNVVIIDQGLDRERLGSSFAGGWQVGDKPPGETKEVRGVTRNRHGMLMAHNVLSVAPEVRLWDVPLIPNRIDNVEVFLSFADAYLDWVRRCIDLLRKDPSFAGPWILLNAWAIFDRSTEAPRGHYSENSAHSFNRLMRKCAKDNIDLVFAAGNCGQFCPDLRCSPYDTGPGRSIFGAHAHASVLTVGAVRADKLWAGASSQGKGPLDQACSRSSLKRLSRHKPDLCAPSFFEDTHDAHAFNGGTSTASALAAGVVAALRSKSGATGDLKTDKFFKLLRKTAKRKGCRRWDRRLGNGVIDPKSAYPKLP